MQKDLMCTRGILLSAALTMGALFGGALRAAPPANFQNETVIATGLTLPTSLEFLPDGRMLITQFNGRIVVVQPGASTVDPTPVLQLTNVINEDVVAGGERGLTNIVADPNFATNGYIYIFYTAGTPQRDRVSRFTMVGNTASLATEFIIWQGIVDSATTDHHGGGLLFGPDGKLYISTGDDQDGLGCQSLTSEHGKMMRYNPDGTIPTDNPFYDGAGPNIDSIWAIGLRNPYRISLDAATGRIYIGDVGWDTIEEVNILVRGANYGWPFAEGPSSNPAYTNPIFSYPHNGRDSSIAGGFVYRGTQFPASYQGVYFYGDYAQNWIRYLTFDASGNVTGSVNFEPNNGAVDVPQVGDPVTLKMGPDGSLYYVDFGWSPTENPATIRRIRYTAANQPPVAAVSAAAGAGRSVNFSSAGSFDPEGQALSYLWTFGDNTTSTAANPTHVYPADGMYVARLALSDGTNTTQSNTLNISIGNAPVGTIQIPVTGQHFHAGDTIYFSGTATDQEDGQLPASGYSWSILFHHDSHVHPVLTGLTGVTSSGFTIPATGHDFDEGTNYEILLTVTDSNGLQHTSSVTIYPELVSFTLNSSPQGLSVTVDGLSRTTPYTGEALVGFQYTIGAPNQTNGASQYNFVSWSDAGAQTHVLTVPETSQSFTATFEAVVLPTPPNQVMALSFNEGTGTAAADDSGTGHSGTLTNGPTWIVGKYGNGLSFDGTNDHVVVANSNTLNFGTADFTVATWVKREATGTEHTIFSKTATNWTTAGKEFFISGSDNSLAFGCYGSVGEVHSTTPITNDGLWHHVAVTFVDSSNAVTLYIDGVVRGSGTLNLPADVAGHVLKLGTNPGPSGVAGYYRGQMDDFRVFTRALSAAEIQTVMTNPSSPGPADTTPPARSGGQPSGTLAAGTTQTTLAVTTNENANLRYSTTPGTPYASMSGTFTNTGGTSHSTTVTGLANGNTYIYYVRGLDAAGNANPDDYAITFSVALPPADTTAPTVSLTAPANGATVAGSVTVSANASDNVGVAGVQFLLDGSPLGAEDTTAAYSVSWDTLTASAGAHTLAARARDAAGNMTTSASVAVTVNNSSPPNQVVALSLSEGSGTATADNSGSNHGGTLTNGPTWTTGKYGSGLQFDGTNDYVLVANPGTLNFGTSNFTIAAWVKRQVTGAEHTIFSKAANTTWSSGAKEFFINAADGRLGFGRNGGTDVFSTGTITNDGLWHHVAVTFVDSSNTLAFYLDGVASGGGTSNLPADNASHVVKVGGHPSGHPFNGAMDEFRVFNRVLSLAEIQTVMNTPLVQPPADTTAPVLSNGQPSGTLGAGTTQVTLSVTTNEGATLRYSTSPGTAYASMSNTFSTTGGTSHSTAVSGLTNGNTYTFYVRGIDSAGNASTSDLVVSFSVATAPVDSTPAVLSNGQPTGTLPVGTTQATLALSSNENATARYSTTPGTAYASMSNTFTTTGGTSHSTTVSGLTNGTTYTYYVRSLDAAGNPNSSDYVISFTVAAPVDSTPAVLSNGQPTGTLPAGTTQATLALSSNENATARYSTTPGTAYASMSNTFTTTGGTSHSTTVSGLTNGTSYTYYVRSLDAAGNPNSSDYVISFAVAAAVDNTPPSVSLTAPADGATVSGSTTVSANASDNTGVVGVQFLLDGAALGVEDTSAPYSIAWDTTLASVGAHSLTARARDAAGNQTTSAAIAVTVGSSAIPADQVMALLFSEGTGTTAADSSGAGHTGTLTNGPTWMAGRYGNGLSLDGTNDYIAVANSNTLNLGTANFTVTAWVKRLATGTEHTIFSKTASTSWTTAGKEFFISGTDNTLAFGCYGSVGEVHSTTTITNDGLWHHVAVTFVDSSNTVTLYIDGVVRGTGTLNLPADVSTHVLKLGSNPGPSGVAGYYRGQLDEFRVFSRALSAAEIQTVMNSQ